MSLEISTPAAAGFDAKRLREALDLAQGAEIDWPLDSGEALLKGALDNPPYNEPRGPVAPRGTPNGVVLRRGKIAATWGDCDREDFSFSVAKSYLALLAGIAVGDGLIADLGEAVGARIKDGGFDAGQNRTITWHHLLQQTSEWEGTLFGLPDQVDRYREVGDAADNSRKGEPRALHSPGAFWEYNDVRVNRLSLCLLQLFKQPLPDVLHSRIMAPVGASNDWRWHGYFDSSVQVDGQRMVSVPGGTHWGGGLFMDSLDHARVGELVRLDGVWEGHRVFPEEWCAHMFTPCELKSDYGYLWWLNTGRQLMPSAPDSSVFASGAGGNQIWVDRELELVMVSRWVEPACIDTVCAAVADSLL